MYNVQDLVSCSSSMGRCEIPDHPAGCRPFERRLKSALPPAPWDEGEWALAVQNGLLIVRADEATQSAVHALLTAERSAAGPDRK
jgi:hypothetical protein